MCLSSSRDAERKTKAADTDKPQAADSFCADTEGAHGHASTEAS
jgi:hypothetical protein